MATTTPAGEFAPFGVDDPPRTSWDSLIHVDSPHFNLDVAVDAVTWIDAHPEHWDQTAWLMDYKSVEDELRYDAPPLACGTAGCLFGTVALRAGGQPVWHAPSYPDEAVIALYVSVGGNPDRQVRVRRYASELLGLTENDAALLSSASNTRHDIQLICTALAAGIGREWPVPLPAWADVL
jgi:hypothetical protein